MRAPYSVAAMLRAQELHKAGWHPTKIKDLLEAEGLGSPHIQTIREWTFPKYRDRQRKSNRRSASRRVASQSSFRWPGKRTPEWIIGRVRALDAIGLGPDVIAMIMSHDFPDTPLTRNQVRGVIKDGSVPHPLRRLAA